MPLSLRFIPSDPRRCRLESPATHPTGGGHAKDLHAIDALMWLNSPWLTPDRKGPSTGCYRDHDPSRQGKTTICIGISLSQGRYDLPLAPNGDGERIIDLSQ